MFPTGKYLLLEFQYTSETSCFQFSVSEAKASLPQEVASRNAVLPSLLYWPIVIYTTFLMFDCLGLIYHLY